MKNEHNNTEILSPCGSWESLSAAIKAGCNSVYFGVEQLNMRARSSVNFTVDDLEKITSFAHRSHVKTYLALNTILYDHDLSLMRHIADEAKKNNVDAIIASDQAVMGYAKKIGIPLHVSTQANISNTEAVEFYAHYADVMVLARELTLEQVGRIAKEIKRRKIKGPSGKNVRIEVFAHGALCMAVSGKCYISLHSHFASANRGACVQNCRRSYVVTDREDGIELQVDNEYIMSAKDLCTIDFLDRIISAGVSVLKIEGRGRSEDYVYTVTKCYREAIDAIASGTFTEGRISQWKKDLAEVFNRGFWDGYYLGRKMGEWSSTYGSAATKKKIYIGKGVKYFDRIGVAEFKMESGSLGKGDAFLVSGPVTGVVEGKAEELRVDDEKRELVKKGEIITMPVCEKVRPSDKLYKIISS